MKNQNSRPSKSKEKSTTTTAAASKPKVPERPNKRVNDQLKVFKEMLVKKKATLTNYIKTELSELEAADKHHLADLEEMASDTHDTDSVCEMLAVGADTIGQIDQALAKIEDGTYGVCEDCGDQIAFERLEALPFATLCVECKKKREILHS